MHEQGVTANRQIKEEVQKIHSIQLCNKLFVYTKHYVCPLMVSPEMANF